MSKFTSFYISFIFAAIRTHAANDWTQHCLSGVCSYDLPTSDTGPSGTLKIWGPSTAIADITTAAGWEILGCSPDALQQDVRIVCRDDESNKGCTHLWATPSSKTNSSSPEEGAVGKIVRLPENCGKGPFARIAKAWVSEDQSVPGNVARRLVRKDGGSPEVKALALDTNFGDSDASKTGQVNFAIVGANVPGVAAKVNIDALTTGSAARRSRVYGASTPRGLGNIIRGLNDIDLDKTKNLDPVDLDQTFNLINQSVNCSDVAAAISIDMGTKAHVLATVGVVASGKIFPPKIEEFGLTSSLTADLDGTLAITGNVIGTLDSGKIKLYEVGIPGLDFPGVLSIGPSFLVNAQAKATLDVDLDMQLGINYHIDNAQFVFPKGGSESGTYTPSDTALSISAAPSVTASGTVEAHLIPSLNFGISALGGTVNAGVFLELDASATMKLTGGGSANGLNATVAARGVAESEPADGGNGNTAARPNSAHKGGGEEFAWGPYGGSKGKGDRKNKGNKKGEFGKGKSKGGQERAPGKTTAEGTKNNQHGGDAPIPPPVYGNTNATITATPSGEVATSTTSTLTGFPEEATTSNTINEVPSSTALDNSNSAPNATTGDKDPDTDVDVTFGGCVEIDTGLNVNVGADAAFLGLFDTSTKLPLFSKQFELFKKCFGDQTQVRRRTSYALETRQFSLACIAGSEVKSLVDELIPSAQ